MGNVTYCRKNMDGVGRRLTLCRNEVKILPPCDQIWTQSLRRRDKKQSQVLIGYARPSGPTPFSSYRGPGHRRISLLGKSSVCPENSSSFSCRCFIITDVSRKAIYHMNMNWELADVTYVSEIGAECSRNAVRVNN